MEIKLFEIRDRGTFIPVMATFLISDDLREKWLLRSSGYAEESINSQIYCSNYERYIILCKLDGVEANYDIFNWSNFRTMGNAHKYIIENWDKLNSGDVIDIEFICKETKSLKESQFNMK